MSEYIYPIISEEDHLPVYLIGIDSTNEMVTLNNSNGFPHYQLIYCYTGKVSFISCNHKFTLKKNEWLYIPSKTPYEFIVSKQSCSISAIMFNGSDVDNLLKQLNLTKPSLICTHEDNIPVKLLSKLIKSINESTYFNGYINSSLVYSLAVSLSIHNRHNPSKNENSKIQMLTPIVKYINNNYSEDITLEELADLISVSPQYICKLFKDCLNTRPFEYITKVRMQYAKMMLVSTKKSVNQISETVGYKDCSYFCAIFKRQEGITPAKYRNSCKYITEKSLI